MGQRRGTERAARRAPLLLLQLVLLLCGAVRAAWVIPVQFQPQTRTIDSMENVLLPLYANSTLFGVFIAGLDFGSPGQALPLLIDTGSGMTHVAGAGCGSACGTGLPKAVGYNLSASATGARLPCGDDCGCALCDCSYGEDGESHCTYAISYLDQSSSTGSLVSDVVAVSGTDSPPFGLTFGVEERQTGVLQGMGVAGILALSRASSSLVGQLRDSNSSIPASFSSCWELDSYGTEAGHPSQRAAGYLMLGQPPAVMAALAPRWAPLVPWMPRDWAVGLESLEVEGPSGAVISSALYPDASKYAGLKASALPGAVLPNTSVATAIVDSGTTYTLVPKQAWADVQTAISAAAAARGKVMQVSSRPTTTCWEGLPPDALAVNHSAVAEAFPSLVWRFQQNASFVSGPEGYLYTPDTGKPGIVCLSIFGHSRSEVLLGNRIRQKVLTTQDDSNERIGFATVDDCELVSQTWAGAE